MGLTPISDLNGRLKKLEPTLPDIAPQRMETLADYLAINGPYVGPIGKPKKDG